MDPVQQTLAAISLETPVPLEARPGVPEQAHLFDRPSVLALQAAYAARRPLLVRGEPGCGKTQLAAAAAKVLGWSLKTHVVDARTESTDLLWRFDPVRRLAEAQVCGALGLSSAEVESRLDIRRFITPGPLWWGFDWKGAVQHLKEFGAGAVHSRPAQTGPARDQSPKTVSAIVPSVKGCVVLIDEIDKADGDVPNGLLEALGAGEFTPEGCDRVRIGPFPLLIIVTTNEERALPDAFVRRCLVLKYTLPTGDALKKFLVDRAAAHFIDLPEIAGSGQVGVETPFADPQPLDRSLLEDAADMLLGDRAAGVLPMPGLAEYLDLLRAVREMAASGIGTPQQLLADLRRYTLQKHVGEGL
ncbi:MAG: MoxR family ATPase [Planctomycetota bacterium]|nr:MoxR family ATPase [Planctomycetota bacterium]